MAWETVPAPNYAAFRSDALGNALGNLVSNYQQAQQGQQRTQANDLRNQQDKMLLDQSKAFAGGLPMNPDGTPNYSAIMKTLAEKGDINAVSSLAPILQQQQNLQGANAPDPILGGGGTSGSTVDTLASNIASRIETKGQSDPYDALGPITKSGDRAYGKYQVMGENIPSWTEEILGVSMTPDQFLADPQAQEAVAHAKLGEYLKETGSPQDAASMWFTGKPLAQGANRKDQNGMSGAQYAATATAGMGGSPVEVASLDPSSASAYANSPDQPTIPPVSAAAGSSIPRANAATAVGAVGGAQPQPSAVPRQLAQNNPAWAGINAALPTGGPGMGFPALGATPSPAPGTPPQANLGGTAAFNPGLPKSTNANGPVGAAPQVASAAPMAPQAPSASPGQGSVASIASSVGIPPQVAANIARALGVAPDAPLTPQQAQRAQTIIQNYAARTQRAGGAPQSASGGQGQASPGGPIIPQFPLPKGFTDPQQAILAIDQDIARLSRFGPAASGRIRALEDMRDRIAKSSAPIDVHAGQTILDPRTGRTLFQAPYANPNTMALQAFMQEHPNATAEEIQDFVASGRGRGGVTQDKADVIAQAIASGDQPPVLTGLYGASSLVRASLAKNGFDLSKAQLQWDAAKKQVTSLNGPQQIRFVGLANSVVNTIDEVKDLAQQMQLSGVPLLNKAKLLAYIQTAGNSEGGQLATRYINAVNTAKEEFANLANGGYAPTDAAWKLADQQINGDYGVKQLTAALTESQRLIKYRLAAMPGLSTAGPGAANRYFPGNEQAPPPPAANSGAPRKISTKADYDALKADDQYEAPDGSIRTKQ